MRGAVGLARRLRVPPVVVALSVVGLGTSLPELVVSTRASLAGYPGLALGNVVGSNIANVLLVGGASAAVFPLRTPDPSVRRSGDVMLAITVLFAGLCVWGAGLTRLDGAILLGILLVTFAVTARGAVRAHRAADTSTPIEWVLGLPSQLPMIAFFIGTGLLVLPLGADFLVDAAVEIANRLGVSETVVGLSVVAVGTSLPEVATTVMAGLRRRTGMVVGTIVGSNIFNILAIMGTAAVVSRDAIPASGRFQSLDLPVMVGVSLGLVSFSWLRRPIGRRAGLVMAAGYVLYLSALYVAA